MRANNASDGKAIIYGRQRDICFLCEVQLFHAPIILCGECTILRDFDSYSTFSQRMLGKSDHDHASNICATVKIGRSAVVE